MDYRDFVAFDPRYLRPAEVEELRGDASKARDKLGWQPTTTVEELVKMMVEHDVEIAQREKTLRDAGHKIGILSGEHDHPFQYNR
jgi:GDPmannose 4,6-dehydratase